MRYPLFPALPFLAMLCAGCGSGEPTRPKAERAATGTPAAGATGVAPEPTPTPTPDPIPTPRDDASDPDARYTALTGCTLLRSAPEEAGFAESRCPGFGGRSLLLVEADARENIVVQDAAGARHSLRIPELSGGGFGGLGERAEWRLASDGAPQAVIVRYSVMEHPDPAVPERSYLFVARLDRSKPCVVAKVAPGPEQNALARRAAARGGACLSA